MCVYVCVMYNYVHMYVLLTKSGEVGPGHGTYIIKFNFDKNCFHAYAASVRQIKALIICNLETF